MIAINSLNESRFTLNGIQYFKNYVTKVAGDSLTIYNTYNNKDVLVPLTHFDQFNINGTIYTTIEELQAAIISVCYTRTTLDEGSLYSQNNVSRTLYAGNILQPEGDPSFDMSVAVAQKLNEVTVTITAMESPVFIRASLVVPGAVAAEYIYAFGGGKGTWGNGGTPFSFLDLHLINVKNYTTQDVETNPAANIISLDALANGDYLTAANSTQYDFSDAGTVNNDGNIISYYFSYSTDDVLYFVQFVGAAGVYNGTFTATDLISSTNSNVTTDIDLQTITDNGNSISKNGEFETFFSLNNSSSNANLSIKNTDDGLISFINDDGTGVLSNLTSGGALFDSGSGTYTIINYNGINLYGDSQIGKYDGNINISANANSAGLSGEHDYTSNITALDYVQKKYVDDSLLNTASVVNPTFTGNVTIPADGFTLSGGDAGNLVFGNGAQVSGSGFVRFLPLGTDNTAGATDTVTNSTGFSSSIFQLQNQITNLDLQAVLESGNSATINSDFYVTSANSTTDSTTLTITNNEFLIDVNTENGGSGLNIGESFSWSGSGEISIAGTGGSIFLGNDSGSIGAGAGGTLNFNSSTGVSINGNAGGIVLNGSTNGVEIDGGGGGVNIDSPNGWSINGGDNGSITANAGSGVNINAGTGGILLAGNNDGVTVNGNGLTVNGILTSTGVLQIDNMQPSNGAGDFFSFSNGPGSSWNMNSAGAFSFVAQEDMIITTNTVQFNSSIDVTGQTNFSNIPTTITGFPTLDEELTNKIYVDTLLTATTTQLLLNDVTDSTTLTGTTDETVLKSFLIAGGTINTGVFSFATMFEKAGITGDAYHRVYINTTNSLTGATRIASLNSVTNARRFTDFRRDFIIKSGGILFGHSATNSNTNGETESTSEPLSTSIDTTNDIYIIFSGVLQDTSDSLTQKSLKITFEKAIT
ncbi:beta strand repeat-containing protein [Flavobacterium litorale]|uniref:Uncharacterized protein n=1 Tax=Flavobacterium litorale TaxID=2856519 RepID=A0ABX8V7W0_9FLAO|nr:hypothetical protein [Flavobacterium litorale]QYJ68939.1 hypothetical protein K1I41_03375 [Flavobacterium litorale]